jgi:hypothetical protein
MANNKKRFTINETDILKFIVDEMNDNSFGIKFGLAEYGFVNDSEGEPTDLLIYRLAFDGQEFNTTTAFDAETYQKTLESFVAMNVSSLSGEFTALKSLEQASYSPILSFLVPIDNPISEPIRLAIQEVRSRLKAQYKTIKVRYFDLEDEDNPDGVEEHLRITSNIDSIDFGEPFTLNAHRYMQFSFSLFLLVQNKGEFGNQIEFKLGKVNESAGTVTTYAFEPLVWDWGLAIDNESVQVLREYGETSEDSKEVKAIPKTKGFALEMSFILDLSQPLHRDFYKMSLQANYEVPTYRVEILTKTYDLENNSFVIDNELTSVRDYTLEYCKPSEPMSKGEQILYSLVFAPKYKGGG